MADAARPTRRGFLRGLVALVGGAAAGAKVEDAARAIEQVAPKILAVSPEMARKAVEGNVKEISSITLARYNPTHYCQTALDLFADNLAKKEWSVHKKRGREC